MGRGREQEAKTGREQETKTGRGQETKTGREQMQGTVLIQSTAHRGTVCTFVRQKYQKRGGFRNAPSTSEGSALRKPRAKQGNRFLAHRLPSTARRRTPARCCTRCPAYAPAIKSPARYSAGRAKQHNPARSVKPFPPRRSPGRTLPGQEGGGQCPLPCPAREVCIAGDSAPGRGHTYQRPRILRSAYLCSLLSISMKTMLLIVAAKDFPAQAEPQLEPLAEIFLLYIDALHILFVDQRQEQAALFFAKRLDQGLVNALCRLAVDGCHAKEAG